MKRYVLGISPAPVPYLEHECGERHRYEDERSGIVSDQPHYQAGQTDNSEDDEFQGLRHSQVTNM